MKKHVQLYLLATVVLGLLVLWGCPKKAQMTTSQETQTEKVTAPATPSAANDSDSRSSAVVLGTGRGHRPPGEGCSRFISIMTDHPSVLMPERP
jgi:hypothetical protein